jgi:L-ascorbate metabolism protein UlaG (beta-lactamase superfamily)
MKLTLTAILAVLIFIAGCSTETEEQETGDLKMSEALDSIEWFGHASFVFNDEVSGNKVYYVDPFELKDSSKGQADIIFITHAHADHCNLDAVKKVLKPDTVLVSPTDCKDNLALENEFLLVEPNREYEVKGFKFKTVPAYNIKPDRLKYHPKENNWVGYIFNLNNKLVYHAGDTDFIDDMKNLGKLDVAMLPIGGTYTMDVDEAIEAANAIAAETTVPIHYRRLLKDASSSAEEKFKTSVTNSKVVILEEVA